MPEFFVLRFLLAVLEFSVAWLIVRRKCGHLFIWVAYCYVAGTADLIPAMIGDPLWWRAAWMPLRFLLLILLAAGVFDAYRFMIPYVTREERILLLAFSAAAGCMLLIPLWSTMAPEGIFGAFTRAREFAALVLAAGHSAGWWYVRYYRPVECPAIVRKHGLLLIAWLWVYWLAAAGAKGGTVWLVASWEGGGHVWRTLNVGCMSAQVVMMAGWAFSLRRLPRAERPFPPAPARFPGELQSPS